jgi:ABC-type multidrug transport system fused ATPase/permease subunit
MPFTQTGFQYSGGGDGVSINYEYDKLAKMLSGPFLVFILIFLVILIFLTASNCAIYGIIATEDQSKEPKIKKGYSIFMLVINVIGLLLLVVLFIWVLLKFKSWRHKIQEGLSKIYNFYKNCNKANKELEIKTQKLTQIVSQLNESEQKYKEANERWQEWSNNPVTLRRQLDILEKED